MSEPAKPMLVFCKYAQKRGSFFCIQMTKIHYTKPYYEPKDLVTLLKARGVIINDDDKAANYIKSIGYYRLSAYMYPYLKDPKKSHCFRDNVSFDNDILMLYRFDKKLKMLLLNEIEKIEVAVRSAVINIGCKQIGDPFWITDVANFVDVVQFNSAKAFFEREIRKSSNLDFIRHFQNTYLENMPPSWMLSDLLTFGKLTNIYNNIKLIGLKEDIAKYFGFKSIDVFKSWLEKILLTRNYCCHHKRVWNNVNCITTMLPRHSSGMGWLNSNVDIRRTYFDICIIKYFIDRISPQNDMALKIRRLLSDFPKVPVADMGFPANWENEDLWKVC